MPTWDDVRAHVRSRYRLVKDEPDWLGMVWTFVHERKKFQQRVKVERIAVNGADWVLVLAAICKADKIDAAGALRFNARLAVGSIGIERNMCYLRGSLPVDTLVLRDLDRLIEVVARETARMRRPGGADVKGRAFFTIYED
jgi:hypothetical protein